MLCITTPCSCSSNHGVLGSRHAPKGQSVHHLLIGCNIRVVVGGWIDQDYQLLSYLLPYKAVKDCVNSIHYFKNLSLSFFNKPVMRHTNNQGKTIRAINNVSNSFISRLPPSWYLYSIKKVQIPLRVHPQNPNLNGLGGKRKRIAVV